MRLPTYPFAFETLWLDTGHTLAKAPDATQQPLQQQSKQANVHQTIEPQTPEQHTPEQHTPVKQAPEQQAANLSSENSTDVNQQQLKMMLEDSLTLFLEDEVSADDVMNMIG